MPNDGTGDAAAAPQPGPAPLGLLHPACSSAASRSAAHRLCSPRGFCLSRCSAPLGAPQPDLPVPQRTGGSCSSPAPHPGVAKPPPAAVLRPSSEKRAAGRSRPPSAPCAAVPGRTAGLPRAMGAAHTRGTAGRAARCRTRALRKHPALPGIPRWNAAFSTAGLWRAAPARPRRRQRCCGSRGAGLWHGTRCGAAPLIPTSAERCAHGAPPCSAGTPRPRSVPRPVRGCKAASPPHARCAPPAAPGAPRPLPLKGLRAAAGPPSLHGAERERSRTGAPSAGTGIGGAGPAVPRSRRCRAGAGPLGAVRRGELLQGRLSAPPSAGTFGPSGPPGTASPAPPPPAAMGEWGFLRSLLDAVQEHSPMGGRCWLLVTLLFRVLVLVGSDVFEDEQEELACNTRQPGCKAMCYDAAFPLSHYRFLLFLVLALSALFLIFAVHQTAKAGLPAGRRSRRLRRFYAGSVALCSAAEVVVVPAGAAAALRLPSAAALRLPPPAGPAPRPLLRVPPHRADRLHPLLLRRRVGVGAAQPGGARPPPAQEPNGPREDPHLRGGGSAAAPPSASCPGCVRRVCRRCDELWLRSAWGGSEVCIGVRKQPCPAAPPPPHPVPVVGQRMGLTLQLLERKLGEGGKQSSADHKCHEGARALQAPHPTALCPSLLCWMHGGNGTLQWGSACTPLAPPPPVPHSKNEPGIE